MKFLTTDLEKIKWVRHGFFTRIGGASEGVYGTLNCAWSSKDVPDNVGMNREKVASTLQLEAANIVSCKQVHSAKVVKVANTWTRDKAPEADALVTDQRGLGLAVLTADCAPILFACKKEKVVGAAHAGWKGALTGVIEATIAAMGELGAPPKDIVAAIGPCIGPQSYEVSEGFEKPFLEQEADNAQFFRKAEKPGHLVFDMPGYIVRRLKKAGVETIYDTKQDTLSNETVFFSYRRTCQRGEPDYGRQISVISIR